MIARDETMKWFASIFVLLSLNATVHAEETKQILLDRIWGYNIPKTRDVHELEPHHRVNHPMFKEWIDKSVIRKIARHLASYTPPEHEIAGPAIVVIGTDKEALQKAHALLTDKYDRSWVQSVPKDTELTLFFYVYVTGFEAKIESVHQTANSIEVKYRFVRPNELTLAVARFALIPIGKFPKGKVDVKIVEMPLVDETSRPIAPKQDSDRYVCNSMRIDVE
jgi:hypothetical protein